MLRFKREFRALADIRHRNLVTLYELEHTVDGWFLTLFWKRDLFAAYLEVGTRYGLPLLVPD